MLEAGLEILVQPVCTGPDVQHTKLVPVFLVSDARPTWSTPKPILRSNVTAPMGGHCVTVQVCPSWRKSCMSVSSGRADVSLVSPACMLRNQLITRFGSLQASVELPVFCTCTCGIYNPA
ncbi:uncharacterized protein ACIB01_003912 isoform 3-T4 [Guaruba guarouba]